MPLREFGRLCAVLWCLLPLQGIAAPQGWTPLLEPAQLSNILAASPEVTLLQVTGDYAAGHVPGALDAPYAAFRGPASNPGELPSLAALTGVVRRLGLTEQTPVVVIHSGVNAADFGAAARVYWTLKSLGIKDLALLNGGFAGWQDARLPVSTVAADAHPSDFTPQWNDAWRATTAQVEALVEDKSARLIDARPTEFFEGLQASSARPGTIRGAGNLSFTQFFEGNRVRAPDQVAQILSSHTPNVAPMTVTFCNTGHQAAVDWFILSELQGVPNTRLYAESMTAWTLEDRPMDHQPNRLRHYWHMTRTWVLGMLGA